MFTLYRFGLVSFLGSECEVNTLSPANEDGAAPVNRLPILRATRPSVEAFWIPNHDCHVQKRQSTLVKEFHD